MLPALLESYAVASKSNISDILPDITLRLQGEYELIAEFNQPFAFESREYLRKLLVGRVVQFQVLYNIPLVSNGQLRDYGIVILQNGKTLPQISVGEGWLKLRDEAGRSSDSDTAKEILEKLQNAEAQAKAESRGIWAGKGGRLETKYEISDPKVFVEEWKGKPIDGIVERVLTGDRLIVRLMPQPDSHIQTLILVAGVRAPSTKRTNPSDGTEVDAEPLGEDAQFFVESRLIQRGVKVDVLGVSPQGQLVATVKHPNGSIAEFVLKEGLARCVDHHSTMLGAEMLKLRDAEKHARSTKVGLFQGLVSSKTAASDSEVTVTRVQTADTIYVKMRNGSEKRINLSSIRQPKPSDPKQAPFQAEAKEFLRKKLIGKHVKMTVDGKKAASEGYEEREVATITLNNKNVAIQLVESGYASVIRHRRDDGMSSFDSIRDLSDVHQMIEAPNTMIFLPQNRLHKRRRRECGRRKLRKPRLMSTTPNLFKKQRFRRL